MAVGLEVEMIEGMVPSYSGLIVMLLLLIILVVIWQYFKEFK